MAWITPKTDWNGYIDGDGNYVGDRFNAADFNRIKNNLEHLREMAVKVHGNFSIPYLGRDRTVNDYLYADEISQLEANLNIINKRTVNMPYRMSSYEGNGRTMTYADLNRIESAILDLYSMIENENEG